LPELVSFFDIFFFVVTKPITFQHRLIFRLEWRLAPFESARLYQTKSKMPSKY
jgi:hypothetical protein